MDFGVKSREEKAASRERIRMVCRMEEEEDEQQHKPRIRLVGFTNRLVG